ncbi:unnamed protein product [Closterium sp. Naga37s-1]|nr:unnamed protein product [Closterium sp. Naga37s-1]
MGHWVKLAVPSSHRMPCSHIVKAAIKRGEAGVERGRVLHRLQLKEHPGRDGCAVKYDADVDPWDMHPVPRGKFSYSSCCVEWIIYSSDCGLSMVRMADFAHMAAIPFAVVGVGVPWRGQGGRMRTIRDYLRSLPPDRIVISTDADDAFLMPGPHCRPENLVEAFLSLNAPVAFGGEIFCYPDWRKIEVFYPRKINETKNWFLNSGAYVGYAWALAKIIDATYVGDCMQDQRAYTLGLIGQQYLFRHLPRVPYPEPSDFESALNSMGNVTAAVAAQEKFADSPFRKPWRNPRPVRYNTTMSPFHRLPPASEEKVISEAMEAGQKDAPSVMAAPFMKLDHYNTLFTHLGGYPWEEFEVVGKGGEAMVRAKSTGGMASRKGAPRAPENLLGQPFRAVEEDYEIGKELGRGLYGITYMARHRQTQQHFACKTITKVRPPPAHTFPPQPTVSNQTQLPFNTTSSPRCVPTWHDAPPLSTPFHHSPPHSTTLHLHSSHQRHLSATPCANPTWHERPPFSPACPPHSTVPHLPTSHQRHLSPTSCANVAREAAILAHLSTGHAGIATLIDQYEDATCVHFILQLCTGVQEGWHVGWVGWCDGMVCSIVFSTTGGVEKGGMWLGKEGRRRGGRVEAIFVLPASLPASHAVRHMTGERQVWEHLTGGKESISAASPAFPASLPFFTGGMLYDGIKAEGSYSEQRAAGMVRQIVQAVQYMHERGVVHRDLKLKNFLLLHSGEDAPLMAIDFGLSTFFQPGQRFKEVVGSAYYVAPEVLRRDYGSECDVWSVGVITYMLLCGTPPFWDVSEEGICEAVLKGEYEMSSAPWPAVSQQARHLVGRMLESDAAKRITTQEILGSPARPAISQQARHLVGRMVERDAARRITTQEILGGGGVLLDEEEMAVIRTRFDHLDLDRDGCISVSDLVAGFQSLHIPLSEDEAREIIQAADSKGSGTLDLSEYASAIMVKRMDAACIDKAFKHFDKEGRGYITMADLKATLAAGESDETVECLIKEIGNKHSGHIDREEFSRMMRPPFVLVSPRAMRALRRSFDQYEDAMCVHFILQLCTGAQEGSVVEGLVCRRGGVAGGVVCRRGWYVGVGGGVAGWGGVGGVVGWFEGACHLHHPMRRGEGGADKGRRSGGGKKERKRKEGGGKGGLTAILTLPASPCPPLLPDGKLCSGMGGKGQLAFQFQRTQFLSCLLLSLPSPPHPGGMLYDGIKAEGSFLHMIEKGIFSVTPLLPLLTPSQKPRRHAIRWDQGRGQLLEPGMSAGFLVWRVERSSDHLHAAVCVEPHPSGMVGWDEAVVCGGMRCTCTAPPFAIPTSLVPSPLLLHTHLHFHSPPPVPEEGICEVVLKGESTR